MQHTDRSLPDPTVIAAALWLKNITRQDLHNAGWATVNRRFHGLALAVRPFINQYYMTSAEQEAVFDGMTLALLALGHFKDIEALSELFAEQLPTESQPAADQTR